jgi:hypothetical protein
MATNHASESERVRVENVRALLRSMPNPSAKHLRPYTDTADSANDTWLLPKAPNVYVP